MSNVIKPDFQSLMPQPKRRYADVIGEIFIVDSADALNYQEELRLRASAVKDGWTLPSGMECSMRLGAVSKLY